MRSPSSARRSATGSSVASRPGLLGAAIIAVAGRRWQRITGPWLQVIPVASAALAYGLAAALGGSGFIAAFSPAASSAASRPRVGGGGTNSRGGGRRARRRHLRRVRGDAARTVAGSHLSCAKPPTRCSASPSSGCCPWRSPCWAPAPAARRWHSSAGSGRAGSPRSSSQSSSCRSRTSPDEHDPARHVATVASRCSPTASLPHRSPVATSTGTNRIRRDRLPAMESVPATGHRARGVGESLALLIVDEAVGHLIHGLARYRETDSRRLGVAHVGVEGGEGGDADHAACRSTSAPPELPGLIGGARLDHGRQRDAVALGHRGG